MWPKPSGIVVGTIEAPETGSANSVGGGLTQDLSSRNRRRSSSSTFSSGRLCCRSLPPSEALPIDEKVDLLQNSHFQVGIISPVALQSRIASLRIVKPGA